MTFTPPVRHKGGTLQYLVHEHNGTMHKVAVFMSARDWKTEGGALKDLIALKTAQAQRDMARKMKKAGARHVG